MRVLHELRGIRVNCSVGFLARDGVSLRLESSNGRGLEEQGCSLAERRKAAPLPGTGDVRRFGLIALSTTIQSNAELGRLFSSIVAVHK